jgi:hypothetical protein
MRLLKNSAWCLAAAALLGLPGQLAAQGKKVELGAFAGLYQPTDKEGLEAGTRQAERRGSLAYGGRLTYWTSKSLGVELTGGYSPARVRVASSRGIFPHSTDQVFGAGKLAINLTPARTGLGLAVSGGVGVLHTGKTIPDRTESKTNVGGVAGATIRYPLWGALLRLDAEDYLYSGDFGKGSKFTQDLVLSGGISLRF